MNANIAPSCLDLCLEAAPFEKFAFKRGEEALAHRVVVTVSHRAHRLTHTRLKYSRSRSAVGLRNVNRSAASAANACGGICGRFDFHGVSLLVAIDQIVMGQTSFIVPPIASNEYGLAEIKVDRHSPDGGSNICTFPASRQDRREVRILFQLLDHLLRRVIQFSGAASGRAIILTVALLSLLFSTAYWHTNRFSLTPTTKTFREDFDASVACCSVVDVLGKPRLNPYTSAAVAWNGFTVTPETAIVGVELMWPGQLRVFNSLGGERLSEFYWTVPAANGSDHISESEAFASFGRISSSTAPDWFARARSGLIRTAQDRVCTTDG